MSKLVYSVHIEPMQKGGFYVSVPALPECGTRARTFNSALSKAKTLIQTHLKTLARGGKTIPTESQDVRPLCLPIRVTLPKGAKTAGISALAA